MRPNTRLALSGFALLVFGIGAGIVLGLRSEFIEEDVRTALEKVNAAHRIVSSHYVDRVTEDRLTTGTIAGMLEPLDPHSVYINPERMVAVNEAFNAAFDGIGIRYEFIDGPAGRDTLAVRTVLPDGPSDRAGLQSGDRIVAVDGKSAVGLSDEAVRTTLKGPRGTTLELVVRRPAVADSMTIRVTRDQVALRTVEAAFMANDRVGYIKIGRFARTTYEEFIKALTRLKETGMERLVLDLRGNTGGLMKMAVQISDEFLGDDQLIVAAQSRHDEFNRASHATGGGTFEDQPVIVLVDERSASASEIIAGALQDHDRALILGERTFGKGLIQQQFTLDDGSALRLTISRFYTPSGRLIQVPYEAHRSPSPSTEAFVHAPDTPRSKAEVIAQAPDSLRYHTDGGRTVVGGGGILPDHVVESDAAVHCAMVHRAAFNAFARRWLDTHGSAMRNTWGTRRRAFLRDHTVGDSLRTAFLRFAGTWEDGRTGMQAEPLQTATDCRFDQLERSVTDVFIKGHLARRLFDPSAWPPVFLQVDPVFTKALQMWPQAESLAVHYPVHAR